LDLGPLHRFVEGRPGGHWGTMWANQLEDLHPEATRVSIPSLLSFGLSDNRNLGKSSYQQLVFGLDRVLDRHLLDLADGCRSESMKCEFQELAFETMTVKRYCELHAVGIRNKLASQPVDFLCCAPGKSSVGSLSLSNTPFSLADNTAFWGCPQETFATPGVLESR